MFQIPQHRTFKLIGIAVLLGSILFWLTLRIAEAQVARRSEARLQSVTDMLVVAEREESVIYVSDNISGGIYYARQSSGETGTIDFNAFKLLIRTAPKYPRPSGLAYHRGYLFVVDTVAGVLLKFNPRTVDAEGLRPVDLAQVISQPEHIAFSDTGVLAVGSDRNIQYFHPKIKGSKVDQGLSDIDRITFDGRSLLALDEKDSGDIYGVDAHPEDLDSADRLSIAKTFPPELRKVLPRIQDFALYRGIYYVAGHQEIVAFSRSQLRSAAVPQPLPVSIPRKAVTDISKIAVSEQAIYIADPNRKAILSVPRPIPVLIDFPKADSFSMSEIPRIVGTMGSSLLTRTILTDKRYESLNELVTDQLFSGLNVFPAIIDNSANSPNQFPGRIDNSVNSPNRFPGRNDNSANSSNASQGRIENSVTSSLAQMICKLNNWACEERKTTQGLVVTRTGGFVGLRNEVVIPNFKLSDYTAEKTQNVAGVNDLSDFLTQLRVVPLSLENNSLTADQVIKVEKSQLNTPSVVGRCDSDASNPVITVPASFPNQIALTVDQFVNQIGLVNGGAYLQRAGVSSVIANYGEVQYEKRSAPVAESTKTCLASFNSENDPSVYIVERVLMAKSANYRFLDRRGKPITIDVKLLNSSPLGGEPDLSKQWTWSVRHRLNLGYVGLRFSTIPSAVQKTAGRPTYLRPTVTSIKRYAQQLTLFVYAKNASTAVQAVNELASNNSVRFYAAAAQDQTFGIKEKSLTRGTSANTEPLPEVTLDQANEKRNRLRTLIHFPPELSDLDLNQQLVGIVEDLSTIEFRHQCFFNDAGEWTWGDPESPEALEAITPDKRKPGKIKTAAEYNTASSREHGTHTSGIIGAKSILPGLTPTARLVRIDAKHLLDDMENNANTVQIFNISAYPPGTAAEHSKLVTLLKDGEIGQKDLLLVIAAGNENQNFGATGVTPPLPVSWLADLPDNIIIVAAASDSDPPRLLAPSNYSKKYVQLMAPAENIYSATKGNTYAPGSGSSQAAPQVTAVAALLRTKNLSAQWIKAVLLYTADWREDLMEDVWAGILNAQAAYDVTRYAGKNLVWFSPDGPPALITAPKRSHTITVLRGALQNSPSVPKQVLRPTREDLTIPFSDVLRIQQMGGTNSGLFRVIYLNRAGEMTMLINAVVQGGIPCKVLREQDGRAVSSDACSEFSVSNEPDAKIKFEKVMDYMRRVPFGPDKRQVRFPIPR